MRGLFRLAIVAALLWGCAGGPGAPVLRASENDGEGPLIRGCSNVSRTTDVPRYVTAYYLTTWSSVLQEGTFPPELAAMLDATPRSDVYCMSYDAPQREVARIVARLLPQLGNPVQLADEKNGNFETGFTERAHQMARWRDRYLISVREKRADLTVVRVFRDVYISRPMKNGYSPYNQAISVGHNEAWILTQIAKQLGQRYQNRR